MPAPARKPQDAATITAGHRGGFEDRCRLQPALASSEKAA